MMVYTILNTMTVTIDKAGRIVVPKELRQRLALRPNTELEIVEQPNGVLLRIPEQAPSLGMVRGLLVHRGRAENGADWDLKLQNIREERLQAAIQR
jgi:AbrB family looped-hinge helix DNA binding protein